MLTNATATLYHREEEGVWTRIPLGPVYWESVQRSTFLKTGVTGGDTALVLVPFCAAGQSLQKEDLIVQGDCAAVVSAQYSVADLLEECGPLRITSVEPRMTGSPAMRHWEVGAK